MLGLSLSVWDSDRVTLDEELLVNVSVPLLGLRVVLRLREPEILKVMVGVSGGVMVGVGPVIERVSVSLHVGLLDRLKDPKESLKLRVGFEYVLE